jgi:DNA invertase Pin-like site-specific DNA recombinase
MNVVSYTRVSTPEQATSGYGLDAQADGIAAWAKQNGHVVVAHFTDAGLSGDLEASARPDLSNALAAIEDGLAQGLVVASLDRLSRTLTTQEAVLARIWAGRNRHVFLLTGEVLRDDPDDPYRTAMRQMAGVFAQLEKAQLLLRMRNGRKAKARRGGYAYGRPPFGYIAKDGALVAEPTEQAVIAQIKKLHRAQHSTRAIAAALNDAGHTTKLGRPWSGSSVSDVLTRINTNARRAA